jgi:hypothetical protein
VCNSYDFHGRLGRRNEKALIFVNDLGILLSNCGGAGLLFIEFIVCPKIYKSDFGDFVDLHWILEILMIWVCLWFCSNSSTKTNNLKNKNKIDET